MKSFRLTILLSLFGLLASPAFAAEDDPAVVVLFGDSTTSESGYAGSSSGSRPRNGALNAGLPSQELTRILNESRRPALVPNWGHGGTPTGPGPTGLGAGTSGVDRISSNLAASKSNYAASQYIVLILYGTNDFNFGLSTADTGANIRFMIDRAREQGYVPVIATVTPRTDRNVASYNSAIRSATLFRNAALVELFDKFVAASGDGTGFNLLLDNVHPNAEGYTVIAETWFNDYLADAIEAQPVTIAPVIMLLLDD